MSLMPSELAGRLGARLSNAEGGVPLARIALPGSAQPQDLCFLAPGARAPVEQRCGAWLAAADFGQPNTLVATDVVLACARAASWLAPRRSAAHRAARATEIAATARIAPGVVIGAGVHIGEHACIAQHVVIEDGVTIGAFSEVGVGSVLRNHVSIGNRVRIGSHCAIGEEGLAYLRDGQAWRAMPAFGSVEIGDDVVLLAHTVVQAGVLGDTVIAHGCVLDSQVLIGHDSVVGAHTAIAGQTAVAGAARIGRGCRIGGKVGIGEGVIIAEGVTVTAMSMVSRSLERAHAHYSSGWPAEPSRRWWRRVAWLRRSGE